MGASIVIVSADEQSLRRTEGLLCERGYSVGIASSFDAGLELLDSATPDVLITDLRLDDCNGLQLATQSRLDHPDVAVIVTSPGDDWWAEGEAQRHGAAYTAASPEDPAFLRCVRAALNSRPA